MYTLFLTVCFLGALIAARLMGSFWPLFGLLVLVHLRQLYEGRVDVRFIGRHGASRSEEPAKYGAIVLLEAAVTGALAVVLSKTGAGLNTSRS